VDPGVRRDDDVFSTADTQVRQRLSFPRTAVGVRRDDDVVAGGQPVFVCSSLNVSNFPQRTRDLEINQ
jgi:hypothetical protein